MMDCPLPGGLCAGIRRPHSNLQAEPGGNSARFGFRRSSWMPSSLFFAGRAKRRELLSCFRIVTSYSNVWPLPQRVRTACAGFHAIAIFAPAVSSLPAAASWHGQRNTFRCDSRPRAYPMVRILDRYRPINPGALSGLAPLTRPIDSGQRGRWASIQGLPRHVDSDSLSCRAPQKSS